MKGKIAVLCSVVVVFFFAGCTVTVLEPETKVKAENDLVDVQVTIGGTVAKTYDAIDLNDVWIGNDVNFSSIYGGEITAAQKTSGSGLVIVSIGSVDAITSTRTVTIQPIDDMTTTISKGTTNTVVFNDATAGVIFSALYKSKAK